MKKVKLFEEFLVETVSLIYESSIGDIHIMAGEADSFTAFRKEFMDEYGKPKSVKELKQLEAWLQTIWNENQTNEALSMDAVYIHQITGSGQDAAQNFIDDNNIDSAKLVAFLKQHKDSKEKYDVRDMINGTNKNKRFLKQFLNEKVDMELLKFEMDKLKKENPGKRITYIFTQDGKKGYRLFINGKLVSESVVNESIKAKDYFKDPMHLADAKGWVRNLKLSDDEIKAKIKAVMKDPAKFNDLMDAMSDELNLKWK
jgi:hypothetical protein